MNPVSLKSRKTVYAWAFEGDCDPGALRSTTFAMEWPPHLGKEQEFPEVDRAEWLSLEEAKEKIQAGQIGFIEEFERIISGRREGRVIERLSGTGPYFSRFPEYLVPGFELVFVLFRQLRIVALYGN